MEGPVSGLDTYLEWQERLKRFESSGLSMEAFCRQEDIGRSTYVDWLRILRKEQLEQAEETLVAERQTRVGHSVSMT